MAIRIRKNGRIFCAALKPEEEGDTYIDDALHYQMSVIHKILVTESINEHLQHGEWWWAGSVPTGIVVADFYNSI